MWRINYDDGLVHWGYRISALEEIVSALEEIVSALEGYHQCIGGCQYCSGRPQWTDDTHTQIMKSLKCTMH